MAERDQGHLKRGTALIAAQVLVAFSLFGAASAEGGPHWDYSAERGPEKWGELSEAFEACGDGVFQSPIDVRNPIEAELSPLTVSYRGSAVSVINNGHTLQVEAGPGNLLELDGQTFELQQFHLHSPSEHRVEGEEFPLEAHLVHENDRGEIAVISLLFREGDFNEGIGAVGEIAPKQVGVSSPFDRPLADLGLLLSDWTYSRYSGSLTTPPCTEGVMWLVLDARGHVSKKQVKRFIGLIGEDARGIQPLNGRAILH